VRKKEKKVKKGHESAEIREAHARSKLLKKKPGRGTGNGEWGKTPVSAEERAATPGLPLKREKAGMRCETYRRATSSSPGYGQRKREMNPRSFRRLEGSLEGKLLLPDTTRKGGKI